MKKLALLFALLSTSALAAPVNISLANGLIANADYQIGKNNKEAIIVVHGFQSTYNYGTIQVIAEELASKGYTVLTPNLTLGVNNRKEPLPCDQEHSNTIADEGKELIQWANWLKSKGHEQLVMIGHSAGSSSILASLENTPINLQQIVLTALYDFDNWPEAVLARDKKTAQQNLQENKQALYSMGLCRGNFLSSANTYLSYRYWDKDRILDTINRSKTPISIIMPGGDKRLEGNNRTWLEQLSKTRAQVNIIKNADHFFSADAEFDLGEAIIQVIERK